MQLVLTLKDTIIMTKQELENNMAKVAGVPVEITIRGKKTFTFSFEGKNETAAKKIQEYFAPVTSEYNYDEECDLTCLYMNL